MTRRCFLFSGRVQGVGFRATAASLARRHGLSGFARNLPDGQVETIVEGDAPTIAAFASDLKSVFEHHIRDCRETESPATNEFGSFDIRF